MDGFDIDGVVYTWDADKRILRNTFRPGTVATRPKAIRVVQILKEWMCADPSPYALLCDGEGVAEIDAGYRQEFARLFETCPNVTLAVYNFPVDLAMIPILFQIATRVNLKAFRTEAEAESWVRNEGFDV